MDTNFLYAFLGGALIGTGAIILMLTNGRIAGVSGIVSGAISSVNKIHLWRWGFILGLIFAPWLTAMFGFSLPSSLPTDNLTLAVAGLIVGVGTQIGAGCTSGHGICGIGRLSKRSIVATATFMSVAIMTVSIIRHLV